MRPWTGSSAHVKLETLAIVVGFTYHLEANWYFAAQMKLGSVVQSTAYLCVVFHINYNHMCVGICEGGRGGRGIKLL